MSYTLKIEKRGSYLYASVKGLNTPENIAGYFREIQQEMVKRDCYDIVVVEDFQGPDLDTLTAYKLVSKAAFEHPAEPSKLAFVVLNPDHKSSIKFGETVARNRGVNIRLFKEAQAAEEWISGKK